MNMYSVLAIYKFEMARFFRTLFQSIASPVMGEIDGVSYGAFIVPGLVMLSILTESVSNGSFGIYMPRFAGTIYEILSAPISTFETVLGYVGASRFYHRNLGRWVRETSSHPITGDNSSNIPRWKFLFNPYASACMAENYFIQSCGLSGKWLSLEPLRGL